MSTNGRRLTSLLVVATTLGASVGLSGACAIVSSSLAGAASNNTVKVAVEGPMSGTQASTGLDMWRAGLLAASQINSRGGVSGRRITIIRADDKADPAAGTKVARSLVSQHVPAVIGPFNSAVGVKNLPIYRSAGVTILRLTSATNTQGFGVTTQPMANQIAPVENQELHGVLHASSVDVLYDPSTYTSGIATQLVALLKSEGLSVPVYRSLSPTATTQQRSAALQDITAHPASVNYLAMYGPQAGLIARSLKSSSEPGRCFVDLSAQGPDFVKAAGTSAATACLNSGVPSPPELPGGPAYVSAYQARFHITPGTWGPFVYDSLYMLEKAAKSSNQWSGSKVRSTLSHTSGFTGVTGIISIQPATGNRVNPPVVVLDITSAGSYVVDPTWAAAAGYQLPSASSSTTSSSP